MAVKTLKQGTRHFQMRSGRHICSNDVHGAARPKAVEGMLLCRHCLTNLDWQRYYIRIPRVT